MRADEGGRDTVNGRTSRDANGRGYNYTTSMAQREASDTVVQAHALRQTLIGQRGGR